MRDVRTAVAKVPLPAGVSLEIGGQYASQQESFRELLGVLALAIGAVLLLLVAQFGSFRGPLAIVLAIPLGAHRGPYHARRGTACRSTCPASWA